MAVEALNTLSAKSPCQHSTDMVNNNIWNFGINLSECSFDKLLCDSDGVKLFTDFLSMRCSSRHLLDFWFACKGFRSKVDLNDPDKSFQVAKAIYRTYVKSDAEFAVPLPLSLKHDIICSLSSYHKGNKSPSVVFPISSRSLFDVAQQIVKSILERDYYPLFLQFINNGMCPEISSGPTAPPILVASSNSRNDCPYSRQDSNISINSRSVLSNSSSTKQCSLVPVASCDSPRLHATSDSYPATPLIFRSRHSDLIPLNVHHPAVLSEDHSTGPFMEQSTCNRQSAAHDSTFESDGKPLAKEPDIKKLTTSSVDPTILQLRESSRNRSRSTRPGVSLAQSHNLAETDPQSFVNLLVSRLEKVKESRIKIEKLLSCVSQVEERDNKKIPAALEVIESASETYHQSKKDVPSTHYPRTECHTEVLNILQKSVFADSEDPQGILDYHCSRIWSDEQEYAPKISRVSSKGPVGSTSSRRRHRGYHRMAASDSRSVTSWDSGVPDSNAPGASDCAPSDEMETKSVVAAASLQALSSSLTELAIVDNEVTSKLVKHMTKQFEKQQQSVNQRSISNPPNAMDRSTFNSSHDPPINSCFPTNPSTSHLSNVETDRFSANCCCPRHPAPVLPIVSTPMRRGTLSSDSRAVAASDSSSAFDSGISSTYDHLPVHLAQAHGNLNMNLRSWNQNKHRSSSHHPHCPPSVMQAPPSPHPRCPNGIVQERNCNFVQNYFAKEVPPHNVHTHRAGSGQLLQRWLMWQSDEVRYPVESTRQCNNAGKHRHRGSTTAFTRPSMVQSMTPSDRWDRPLKVDELIPGNPKHQLDTTSTVMSSSSSSSHPGLIVGYYLCDDPVPYRTVWIKPVAGESDQAQPQQPVDTASLTLGQFKQLIAKKGVYRYFFKKPSDEFDSGAVHEELTQDDSVLPLWDGKVVARIERAE